MGLNRIFTSGPIRSSSFARLFFCSEIAGVSALESCFETVRLVVICSRKRLAVLAACGSTDVSALLI